MKRLQNFVGGVAGAIALNVLHEGMKRLIANAPRIDLLGQEAVARTVEATGHEAPTGRNLFLATLTADVSTNSIYYAMIGEGEDRDIVARGAAFGLMAGIGALALPKPLGLNDQPVTRTTQTKIMTVAWYLAGGIVTALTIRALRSRQ